MSGMRTHHPLSSNFTDTDRDPVFDLLSEDARKYELAARNSLKDQSDKIMNGEDETRPAPPPRPSKVDLNEADGFHGACLNEDGDSQSQSDKKIKSFSHKTRAELEADLKAAMTEVYQHSERVKDAQVEAAILHKRVDDLTRNLHEQQDFIFSLQPRREQITGSEAASEFGSLCASVEEWVETSLADAIDERRMVNERVTLAQPARDFFSLITLPGQDAFGAQDTDIYNVKAAVVRFLIINVFELDFYCTGKTTADFVTSLQKSIANLQPRRDLAAQRSWRSETFTAIANRPEFKVARRRRLEDLTFKLYAMLSMFLPRHNKGTFTASIQHSIIEPSLILAHKLQLSVDKYTFNYTYFHKEKPEARTVIPRTYAGFECVDLLRGGRLLKFPEAGEGTAGLGYITYILDVTPALMFESVKGDSFSEPQVLRKPKILVAATKEGQRPFVVPHGSAKNTTLLGFLDDLLHPKRSAGWRGVF